MKYLKTIGLVVLATAMTIGLAMQAEPAAAEGSAALSITPKKNYNIEPGKTVNDTLTIRNLDSEQPLNLNLRVVDFTFTDQGGTPKLMLAEDAPQTTWSLKPFLNVVDTVTVDPSSTETLDMTVSVPENHGAGSYYSAIVYSSSDSDGGNVGLSASGVTLVFTSIPGDVNEKIVLEKLGAYNDDLKKFQYFNTQKPREIGYTLRNEGNVTESPVGSLTLKNWFGHEVIIQDINPNGSLALIGQTRTFESCIKLMSEEVNFNGSRTEATACAEPTLWPGYYRVELNAFYGQNGNRTQELTGTAGFWYLPVWFLLATLAALTFIGYHVWRIVRYMKRRKGSGKFKKRTTRRK
jgi:hypothetical protein